MSDLNFIKEDWKSKNQFNEKYVVQCEIIHRLISEKLFKSLEKASGNNDPTSKSTWTINAEEIKNLSEAFYYWHLIRFGK